MPLIVGRQSITDTHGFHLYARELDTVHSAQLDILTRYLHSENAGYVNTVCAKLYPRDGASESSEVVTALMQALRGNPTYHWDWQRLMGAVIHDPNHLVLSLAAGRDDSSRLGAFALSEVCRGATDVASLATVVRVLDECGYEVGQDKEDDTKVGINIAVPTKNGLRIYEKRFDRLDFSEVAENYRQDVQDEVPKMVETIRNASNGLFVLNGPPGTGKSYLIRSLLSELRKDRQGVICTPPQPFLADLGMLTDASMDFSDLPSVVVLEDAGELLLADNVTQHVNETSNLLNMADGLLSLMANVVFLLTFNTDGDKLNPALLRPGRCLGQLTVNPLLTARAEELTGLDLPDDEYTLAEVYEMRRTGKPVERVTKKRRAGFGV